MYSSHRCRVYPVRISTIIHWKAGQRWVGMLFIVFLKIPLQQSATGGFETPSCSYSEFFVTQKQTQLKGFKKNKKQKTAQTLCIYFIPVLWGEEGREEPGGRKLRPGEAMGRVGRRNGVESDLGYRLWLTTEGERLKKDTRNGPSRRVQVSTKQPRDRWTLNRQNILDWRKCQVPYAAGWQLWSSTRALEWETASVCMATVMLRLSVLSSTQICKSKPFCSYSTCLHVHLFRSGKVSLSPETE